MRGARTVLDRTPILFIKSELHCGATHHYVIKTFYFKNLVDLILNSPILNSLN